MPRLLFAMQKFQYLQLCYWLILSTLCEGKFGLELSIKEALLTSPTVHMRYGQILNYRSTIKYLTRICLLTGRLRRHLADSTSEVQRA